MIQVAVRRSGEFQRPETDVVQSLVVDAESLVGVLDELVNGKSCVVRLDDCVGNLTTTQCQQTTLSALS